MALALIRMQLAMQRNSLSGWRLFWFIIGALVGLLAAIATLLGGLGPRGEAPDLLALTFAFWTFGWIAGALFGGAGAEPLKPEYFSLLPIAGRRLAGALLLAAFAGVAPILTLLAFSGLVVYAARLGPLAALVAVAAAVLHLALAVLVARVLSGASALLVHGRLSAVAGAVPWAVAIALMGQTRFVGGAFGDDAVDQTTLTGIARVVPSGWGVAAVEAANDGEWPLVIVALAGLAAMIGLLLVAWGRILSHRLIAPRAAVQPAGETGSRLAALADRLLPRGPLGAVTGKELRTWSRDLVRLHYLSFGVIYGVTFCLLPLLGRETTHLPFLGLAAATMSAATASHIYSSDGTGISLTLLAPAGAGADVRGRQLALALVLGLPALLLTLAVLLLGIQPQLWPWALAGLPVIIGGAAGLVPLISQLLPTTMVDAHQRSGNPNKDAGNLTVVIWLTLALLLAGLLPALAVVAVGGARDSLLLEWAGLPVGIATGLLLAWGLGRIAIWRLDRRGPELLLRLRAGPRGPRTGNGEKTDEQADLREHRSTT